MSQNPLQQFARQLHAWSTDELQKKPGPFRTAELSPNLLIETGLDYPTIVFWVNRDSHLAGGVILFPKKDPTEVLDSSRAICAALGLDCYYTWGVGEVSAWQVDNSPGRQWSEPLSSLEMHEESNVREMLFVLLENMQNRFFKNQHQLPVLSTPYLTNLLHGCIESIPISHDQKDEPGRQALAGVIMQLLSLYSQGSLPARTSPAKLLIDLSIASERLPVPMARSINYIDQTKLSEKIIIKLHHLCQRLQQHGSDLIVFIPETVNRLLAFWSETSGLLPLPAPLERNKPTLIIFPDRYHPEMTISIEIGAPSYIAATALLRRLQSQERRHPEQFTDLLELRTPIEVDAIIGTIKNHAVASAPEQKKMNALLRYSWPNRHLKLISSSPEWAWRIVHLAGLIQGTPNGTLNLPADWLWSPYGEQFFALLSERVVLSRIVQTHTDRVNIEFNRSTKNQITVESFIVEERVLDNQNKEVSRADLLLALSLPTNIYDLIRNGELESTKGVSSDPEAVELFLRSSVGRGIWQILAPNKMLPGRTKISAEIVRTGLPLPREKALEALAELARKHEHPDTASIDRELEVWLGSSCMSGAAPCFKSTVKFTRPPSDKHSAAEIASSLLRSGEILSFPQDYLYATPENARKVYSITTPLEIGETFFNTITLLPLSGEPMNVEGMATARALRLISSVQVGEFDLPDDEHQVGVILDRYLHDLRELQIRIHKLSSDSGHAGTSNFADQIWNHLPVPPQALLNQ